MRCEEKTVNGVFVFSPMGMVRISTQVEFKDILDGLVANHGSEPVVLNLNGIVVMESFGAGAIINTMRAFKDQGGQLALCCLVPDVKAIFTANKFDRMIKIFNSEAEAVSGLAG